MPSLHSEGAETLKFDFNCLLNKKVSLMMIGKNDQKESYVGVVSSIFDDFVQIRNIRKGPNDDFPLDGFLVRKELIISIWIYHEGK